MKPGIAQSFNYCARITVLSLSFFVILAHVVLGYFAFPQLDDYSTVGSMVKNHITLSTFIEDRYFNWSGRLATYVLVGLATTSPFFPYHVGMLVSLSVALFAIALVVSFAAAHRRFSLAFIADTAFLLWILPPTIKGESFYWLSGNINYLLPTSLLLLTLALAHRLHHVRYENALRALLCLSCVCIATFNEQLSLAALAYAGMHMMLIAFKSSALPSPIISKRMIAVFLGLCLGFAVSIIAPGNYIRYNAITHGLPQPVPALIHVALGDLAENLLTLSGITLCFGFVRAYLFPLPALYRTPNARAMCVYVISALLIAFGMLFTIRYGYNSLDEEGIHGRLILIPQVFIVFCVVLFSDWLFHRYSRLAITPLVVLIACIPTLYLSQPILSERSHILLQSLALASTQQASAFRQVEAAQAAHDRGDTGIVHLPRIEKHPTMFLVVDIKRDPNHWINVSLAGYFGLEQVVPDDKAGQVP